ncbi:hypothetical protein, partial [Saccharothrix sp. Mg75]|uniref:hypothetical protein n=1 Tax=Saccharothrix sp. Mg75 TaxID=3445357 RepID=UPI003EECDC61
MRSAHVALEHDDPPVPVACIVIDEQLVTAARAAVGDQPGVEAQLPNPRDVRTVRRAATTFGTHCPGRRPRPGRPVVLGALTIR